MSRGSTSKATDPCKQIKVYGYTTIMRNGSGTLSTEDETRIVILLAQNTPYKEIQAEFEGVRTLTSKTITKVKCRNEENLRLIEQRLLKRQEQDALSIKVKANKLIDKRLDQTDQETEIVAKANKEYLTGEMPHEEYIRLMKSMKSTSIPELVSVSKEMHNQSQTDKEPETPQKDLQTLIQAIKGRDEVEISKIVFRGSDDISQAPKEQPTSVVQAG